MHIGVLAGRFRRLERGKDVDEIERTGAGETSPSFVAAGADAANARRQELGVKRLLVRWRQLQERDTRRFEPILKIEKQVDKALRFAFGEGQRAAVRRHQERLIDEQPALSADDRHRIRRNAHQRLGGVVQRNQRSAQAEAVVEPALQLPRPGA